jgi:hypothetical protein
MSRARCDSYQLRNFAITTPSPKRQQTLPSSRISVTPHFQPDLAETNNTTPDVSSYVSALTNLHEELRAEIKYAQIGHTEQANKGRQPDPILKPGDKVWL